MSNLGEITLSIELHGDKSMDDIEKFCLTLIKPPWKFTIAELRRDHIDLSYGGQPTVRTTLAEVLIHE